MNQSDRTGGTIQSARRLFDIVEYLNREGSAGVTVMAEEINIPKSTVHGYLATLENLEYVTRDGDEYKLGLKFLNLGMGARNAVPIYDVIKPILEDIAEETGEIAWLFMEEHGWAVNVDRAMGDRAVRANDRIGRRSHLHYHAAGKAMLAHFPEEKVEWIISKRGLPAQTEHTITNPDELYKVRERIRERGVALNDKEETEGTRAVGTPIIIDGEVLGAISVGAPAKRMKGDVFREEIPDLLLGYANEIEVLFNTEFSLRDDEN